MPAKKGRVMKPIHNSAAFRLARLLSMICALALGYLGASLTSCNTTAGLGRDLQKVGDKIEDTSRR